MEWEYCIRELSYQNQHERELNEMGKAGWELVTIVYRPGLWPLAYFKRAKS